jgi:cytochrome P450
MLMFRAEWKEIHLDQDAAQMIARLSTAIFMPALARNEEWLKIAVDYTVHFFTGAYVLRMIPPPLRPIVHWFLPFTRQLRKDVAAARLLIMAEVKRRTNEESEALKAGIPYEKPIDALQWVETTVESTGLPCDPVYGQLNYTLGAVHTTSVTLTNTIYDLLARPKYIDLLLEEIKNESEEGHRWTKGSLSKLKLMDSFMKETTRLTPVTMCKYPINFSLKSSNPLKSTLQPRGRRNIQPL